MSYFNERKKLMTKKNEITPKQRMTLIKKRLSLLVLPIQELWYGITHGTLPWGFCQIWALVPPPSGPLAAPRDPWTFASSSLCGGP